MRINEIATIVDGEVLVSPSVDIEVEYAFAADLMSDILAFARPQLLMLTGLINPQTIRTAEMSDIPLILFVRGKRPPELLLTMAQETGVGILLSDYSMYETSGLLYQAGLAGLGKLSMVQQQ
ncbi:MAG: transcriptional regulator [Chloroflexota bacterium]|nr:transcriptional regulator [Chloroflexota bacterium]